MSEKSRQARTWIISLFIGGIVLSAIGLTKGQDIASYFSRPGGAVVWTISENLVLGWTYIPVMVGVSMMVLSMIFITVLFVHWLKEPQKYQPEAPSEGAQASD